MRWPPSFLLWGQKRYGHRVELLWNPKFVMAIDSNGPSLKKRYGHRLKLPEPEKPSGHRLKLSGVRKALWPPTFLFWSQKRYGHRLELSWNLKSALATDSN